MPAMSKKVKTALAILLIGCSILIPAIAGQYSKKLCNTAGYYCIKVKHGESWSDLWPDADKRRIVMRVNRMNTEIYPGMIIAVPDNLMTINHLEIAPFPYLINSSNRKIIVVDTTKQAFAAYDSMGYLVHWGPISSGRGWCPDMQSSCNTPRGTFYVSSKGGADCISSKFPIPEGGAPMPFCMYFRGGYALHAGELPGYSASHGCVRMFYEDAEWLNRYFIDMGRKGTIVIVR
jgi:L,D-transpeptidase ErfK/SrfK